MDLFTLLFLKKLSKISSVEEFNKELKIIEEKIEALSPDVDEEETLILKSEE